SVRNRSRRYHLIRRTSMRKQITHSKLAGPRIGHSGSISRRKRGSLHKTRISLPIVPPEMIDYIDKRHPTAINVGGAPPIVASTEMLRELRLVPDDEYQGNIAAFASFAMKQKPAVVASNETSPPLPPRRQSIAKANSELPMIDTTTPASLALSPADSSRTKASSVSPDISSQVYTPRSAGKVASRVDVGRSPSSPQAVPTYVRPGNPESPATSMLWSPVTVGGAASLLESTDNTLRPYSDIPDSSTMTSPKFATTSPRPHSAVVPNAASMDMERPQRLLSPTEHANASLFSMLDATQTDASNGNYSVSDIERDDSQDSSLANMTTDGSNRVKGLDKPARIRRRAQTSNVGGDSSSRRTSDRVTSRLSTNVEKAGGGVSRLSKILGGFGLGGSKNKPQPHSALPLTVHLLRMGDKPYFSGF
ncbi:hypothetical protein GGH13_005416, partial [Coemansia sp. S155-1]